MNERNPRDDALALLARREYAAAEISDRLSRYGHDSATITATLERLQQEGLQSDARFVEHFMRSRVSRLQGPRKISAELRGRGLDDRLIRESLVACEVDWFELAAQALARRFDGPGEDIRARARRQRFLASRGFDGEQSRYALEHAWSPQVP